MGLSKLFFGKPTRHRRKQKRVTRRKIRQNGGQQDISVQFQGKEAKGNLRARSETQLQPIISWSLIPDTLYTVLMWDPDAPEPSWIHLFVVNTPSLNLTQGQTLLSYTPPTPPSGIHRYYVTVYKQPQKLEMSAPVERGNFRVDEFVAKHQLQKIGEKMIRVKA